MCDEEEQEELNSYTYELLRFDSENLRGYVSLSVNPRQIVVEDYTAGGSAEEFFGSSDREYTITIEKPGALKMLEFVDPGSSKYPVERLALYLAERFTGDKHATSSIKELADKAGAAAKVWSW